MGEEGVLILEKEGPVSIVTLNRPEARNALSTEMLSIMVEAWDRVDNDPDIRVCILTGAGGYFCAGMDLEELQGSLGSDREVIWEDAQKLATLYDLIYTLPKPTIAAVNGHAVAGGLVLALACGPLGVWILLYRQSYAAESIAHAALPGLVLASLSAIPLVVGAGAAARPPIRTPYRHRPSSR